MRRPPVVNLAAYKFVTLTDLPAWRERLLSTCLGLELMGTVLLSTEGINLCVAGSESAIEKLRSTLEAETEFSDLMAKFSYSQNQPFNRMLVKVKREIIAFDVPGIDPRRQTAPRLSPKTLKDWLDEGRPIHLLDTRNDYEVELGTFRGAIALDLDHFKEFPDAAKNLGEEVRNGPIVAFCTGGIRCEKAAPFLSSIGCKEVYQLDGGILKYFEECGGAHYEGDCFVFDHRVSLDASLKETDAQLCFSCQAVLSAEDLASPEYVLGESCPKCSS